MARDPEWLAALDRALDEAAEANAPPEHPLDETARRLGEQAREAHERRRAIPVIPVILPIDIGPFE
jgi:hypothetical protein